MRLNRSSNGSCLMKNVLSNECSVNSGGTLNQTVSFAISSSNTAKYRKLEKKCETHVHPTIATKDATGMDRENLFQTHASSSVSQNARAWTSEAG